MAKRATDYDFDQQTKTIRFDDEERARLRIVMRSVRSRNALVDPSKLIKELMGLTQNIGLTEEERATIAGEVQASALKIQGTALNPVDVGVEKDEVGTPPLITAALVKGLSVIRQKTKKKKQPASRKRKTGTRQ